MPRRQRQDAKHNRTIKDKISACMKKPFENNCLSSFGGPIQPFMDVGGYRHNDFSTSNTLFIDYKNDEHLEQAMSRGSASVL